MARHRRGKLAYKLLIWFLLLSLVPTVVVGINLISIAQNSLKRQTLETQESMAVGFADTAYKYVMTFKNVLSETANEEDFSTMDPAAQKRHLNRLMQMHPAILELSVSNAQGREILVSGRYLGPTPPKMRDFSEEEFFSDALSKGQYVGGLERFQGLYPALTTAVAIYDLKSQPPRALGVLSGKISLNGLSSMLAMEFPQKGLSSAAVASLDGFLIADSNPKEVFRSEARLSDDILKVIATQSSDRGGGEISLQDGSRYLGAYSDVKDLGWMVYIQQPIESAYQPAAQMKSQIMRLLIWVILMTVIVSWFVASRISQPVRLLREAADQLGRGQFEDLPQVVTTNDEIGDLAETFLAMSESLKEKTGELINAKQELEKFTKFLEKRVESRTRELKSAQDELIKKERLAAIGQMASVVGHEIRNPLAVINNSTYFIKTKLGNSGPVDAKIDKHIKIIESEIQQANGIINEILTYSRQRELKPERVSLNEFMEEILSLYPFPPHIKIEKSFDPKDGLVDIDKTEIQQGIRNLIGNAVEVMPKEGTLGVRTVTSSGALALIEIWDTGPGIPPDVLDKIFMPFFTTKARGTGLGLAVVRKVIDRHKGRVDVQSVVGKGTVFRLYLPLVQAAAV